MDRCQMEVHIQIQREQQSLVGLCLFICMWDPMQLLSVLTRCDPPPSSLGLDAELQSNDQPGLYRQTGLDFMITN